MILPGCFIASHSFNHGKLLDSGERMITGGFGWRYAARYMNESDSDNDSLYSGINTKDSTRLGWFNYAFDYRIGVLRKYPFGQGIEAGFHTENAMRGNQYLSYDEIENRYAKETFPEVYYLQVLEIETRFGLPDITLKSGIFHHNAFWGWTVGQWVDNGWFWGYAAGLELKNVILFSSLRYLITGTDRFMGNMDFSSASFFRNHSRSHVVRLLCGTSIKMPFNQSFLPEYISPEISLNFPNYNKVQPVGFSVSVGLRWKPGF